MILAPTTIRSIHIWQEYLWGGTLALQNQAIRGAAISFVGEALPGPRNSSTAVKWVKGASLLVRQISGTVAIDSLFCKYLVYSYRMHMLNSAHYKLQANRSVEPVRATKTKNVLFFWWTWRSKLWVTVNWAHALASTSSQYKLSVLFAAGVGIMPLNMKGFKDTTTHDFMFKASRADADSLPVSMKCVVLLSHYVRV